MRIKSIKYFMIISGTWNADWTQNPTLRAVQVWFRRILQLIVFVLNLLMVAKLIELISIGADFDIIYKDASLYLTVLAMCIKAYIFQQDNVSKLFLEIMNDEKKISKSTDQELVNDYKRRINIFIKIKNGIMNATLFITVPFFLFRSISYMKGSGTELKIEKELLQESFIIPIWLPFKERDNLISVLFINILLSFCSGNLYLSTEITCFTLLIYVVDRLRIIYGRIQALDNSVLKNTDHKPVELLREIVEEHLFIINFVNKLNKYMSYVMLTNFLANSINLAAIAIVVLSETTLRELAFPITHLLHMVLYVFVLGWFANEVKVQSLAIGDALYQTGWYNQDVRIQKLLLVMMRQSQQPLTVSIGPFAPMTIETSLRIMQAAYSYVMLMSNFK